MKNLNDLAKRIHEGNKKWWVDLETGAPIERNRGELLMLVITELSEAVEGIRKNLMDDKLPHRKMEEVEMADAKIRLCDFAGGFQIDFNESESLGGFFQKDGNKSDQILTICSVVVSLRDKIMGFDVTKAVLLIEHYCKTHNLDLDGAIEEKLAYNDTREDHTVEARRLANGKKF